MRNPRTIPLTKDKTKNLIISEENIVGLCDGFDNQCVITVIVNGNAEAVNSELSAIDLYEEICSPSKP